MNRGWNADLTDEQLEQLNLRAKSVLADLQAVATATYQRRNVSQIAEQLGCSRDRVIWMQHVLQLRGKAPYLGRFPLIDRR